MLCKEESPLALISPLGCFNKTAAVVTEDLKEEKTEEEEEETQTGALSDEYASGTHAGEYT